MTPERAISEGPTPGGATWAARVRWGWQGRYFEDFVVGDVYEHPLARTITAFRRTFVPERGASRAAPPRPELRTPLALTDCPEGAR
jgi:hypothetical protein